jgi:hypothetical protein
MALLRRDEDIRYRSMGSSYLVEESVNHFPCTYRLTHESNAARTAALEKDRYLESLFRIVLTPIAVRRVPGSGRRGS